MQNFIRQNTDRRLVIGGEDKVIVTAFWVRGNVLNLVLSNDIVFKIALPKAFIARTQETIADIESLLPRSQVLYFELNYEKHFLQLDFHNQFRQVAQRIKLDNIGEVTIILQQQQQGRSSEGKKTHD